MSRGGSLKSVLIAAGVIAAAFTLGVSVHTQEPGASQGLKLGLYKGRQVAAGEVLVKYRADAQVAPLPADLDADRDDPIGDGTVRRIHSRSHNLDTLLAKLGADPDVEYAEPNYVLFALATPNDPYYTNGSLWGLNKIGAPTAWSVTTGGVSNAVAVVDTGIDYTHPDLAANVWSAPAAFTVTIGSQAITCPQFSHGFNAIALTCDPMDDNGHGTHVSGTIGAAGNNGIGVVGVNWTTRLVGSKFLDKNGSGTTADAVNAVEFAIQVQQIFGSGANVRILSNSWGGGGFSQTLYNEIQRANTANMLFVAAAGNSGTNNDTTPFYPASYGVANVVSVAATDSSDNLASFSNYGVTSVDLAAPGVNILSTYPGSSYAYGSGTSMATPHVSGAAALVLSACGTGTTTQGLISAILSTVDPLASLSGKVATGGRLNVGKAASACGGSPPPPTSDFSIAASPASQSVRRGGTASYTITLTSLGTFAGNVALSASGLANGLSATIRPSPVGLTAGGTGSAILTVVTSNSAKTKTYGLTITGTGGGLTHSTVVQLTVTR